jgi:hypothetical protein
VIALRQPSSEVIRFRPGWSAITTHGFSDQYLVELEVFLARAREAGLVSDERFQAKFPPSDLATVSINFFTAEAPKQ